MGINKVIYGNTTLIDLTDTTATASDVAQGKIMYSADGTRTVGIASPGVPSGGSTGEVLTKNSDNDYDVIWSAGGGGEIPDNSITDSKLKVIDLTSTPSYEGIDGNKLKAGTVGKSQLASGAVTAAKLSSGAALDNIGTGGITATYIASNAVTAAKISADAVTTAKIKDSNVTAAKLSLSTGDIPVSKIDGAQSQHVKVTISIAAADWNNGTSVTKSGLNSAITSSATIIVAPAPGSSTTRWRNAGVYCSAQASKSLTFTCSVTPTSTITVYAIVLP